MIVNYSVIIFTVVGFFWKIFSKKCQVVQVYVFFNIVKKVFLVSGFLFKILLTSKLVISK